MSRPVDTMSNTGMVQVERAAAVSASCERYKSGRVERGWSGWRTVCRRWSTIIGESEARMGGKGQRTLYTEFEGIGRTRDSSSFLILLLIYVANAVLAIVIEGP